MAYLLQSTSGLGVPPLSHTPTAGSNTLLQYSFDRSTSLIESFGIPTCVATFRTSVQSRSHWQGERFGSPFLGEVEEYARYMEDGDKEGSRGDSDSRGSQFRMNITSRWIGLGVD